MTEVQQAMPYTQEAVNRVLTYTIANIGRSTIASATGLTEEQILMLEMQPEFQELLAQRLEQKATESLDRDELYDSLESQALTNLHKIVARNLDPDLNLRIAMMANRAIRRSTEGPRPLDASSNQGVARLKLGKRFVEKLRRVDGTVQTQETTLEATVERVDPASIHDFLNSSDEDDTSKASGFDVASLMGAAVNA